MSKAPKRTVSAVGTKILQYGIAGLYLKAGTVSSQDLSAKFLQFHAASHVPVTCLLPTVDK